MPKFRDGSDGLKKGFGVDKWVLNQMELGSNPERPNSNKIKAEYSSIIINNLGSFTKGCNTPTCERYLSHYLKGLRNSLKCDIPRSNDLWYNDRFLNQTVKPWMQLKG